MPILPVKLNQDCRLHIPRQQPRLSGGCRDCRRPKRAAVPDHRARHEPAHPHSLLQANAYAMMRCRAVAAGIATKIGNHSFRARDRRLPEERRHPGECGHHGQPRQHAHHPTLRSPPRGHQPGRGGADPSLAFAFAANSSHNQAHGRYPLPHTQQSTPGTFPLRRWVSLAAKAATSPSYCRQPKLGKQRCRRVITPSA